MTGQVLQFRPSQAPRHEPWITKQQLADDLGCSPRLINYRMNEGMPYRKMFGRCRYQRSAVESWLIQHGYIEEH